MREDVNLEQVKELVRLVEEHGLAELTVEENGVTITVKGAAGSIPQQVEQPIEARAPDQPTAPPPPVQTTEEDDSSNLVKIEAPMVGVFYRAPSPDSPAFVDVGDVIEVGQTIGLIEAMKVFSEIPSEVAGEVVEIPAENGKLVQHGQPLIIVRPV